jgi:hypothetical protein
MCERVLQCGSVSIITPPDDHKITVIALLRETFISDEREDCTWHYLHILRFP